MSHYHFNVEALAEMKAKTAADRSVILDNMKLCTTTPFCALMQTLTLTPIHLS